MKKLTLLVAAVMLSAFSFAQDKGDWSFGVGGDFTTLGATPNAGYFVMDGLMVGASFSMDMADDGHTHWGMDARYYVTGDMFAQAGISGHTDHDPDFSMAVGCSKELGFDGKLWFEPCVMMTMPGEGDGWLGLGWGFRYTF